MQITKLLGGGTSWFYAMSGPKIIAASHEDDKQGMEKLQQLKKDYDENRKPMVRA